MTRKQTLKQLILKLHQSRIELNQAIAVAENNLFVEPEGDSADLATQRESAEVLARLTAAESHELEQVEDALARHRERKFGLCVDCGKSIPLVRLKALPYATHCIGCQNQTEAIAKIASTSISANDGTDYQRLGIRTSIARPLPVFRARIVPS